ncbi:MAG: amidohydrolase family protein [Cyclobacteriaceae bacterium]
MKNFKYIFLALTVLVQVSFAQKPVPAPPQSQKIALTGGTAHIGNGQVINNALITFDNGKITDVVDGSTARIDLTGYEVINVAGKQIYPGFILANSSVGLEEVSNIRAMQDANEEGNYNPNVRALISYNADSEYPPTFRFNGVLLAETTPQGGTISGSSSLMEMEGWNWEDAVNTADIGIHLNWPAISRRQFDFSTFTVSESPNKDYDKEVTELEQFFSDAVAYGKQANKVTNLKMEAMQGLFDGSKVLFIHTNNPKEIVTAVRSAQQFGVKKITLISGGAARWVADFLKENNIPVILPATHNLPERPDDDVDMPYKLPHLLTQAGVTVALHNNDALHGGRNLPFYAGTAAAYGMSKEDALKTVTLNVAKALGVESKVGTLENGKDATLFVSEGDALDYRTSVVLQAFIRGKKITLPGNQQELYDRYSKKYGQTK